MPSDRDTPSKSPMRALIGFIATVLAILTVIIAAGVGGIVSVDILRGYASGGTHYAKGHLNAVAALRRYAVTGAAEDLYRYRHSIHVPRSDRFAREVLEEPDLPIANSYPFLISGNNQPDDVPGIAWMFRAMGWSPLFGPAVDAWRRADREVQNLDDLADRLHAIVTSAPGDLAARDRLLRELHRIDARLAELEGRFALKLGQTARGVAWILYAGLAAFGLALAALIVVVGWRTHYRLTVADREIRDREERFRDVAEMAADWIWETDAELRYSYLSDRVEEVAGTRKCDFLGKARADILEVEDPTAWSRHMEDLHARRPFRDFEYAFRHPSGVVRHFRINGKPVLDAAGAFRGYRGTGSDVTEEVNARREVAAKTALLETVARDLQTAKIAAEAASQAKSSFLANMSHELRTPLNAVIGFADLMADERFGPLGPRYAGYARDIRQSGQHLLAVINDILDITRVEAGKIELDLEPVAPGPVVEGCLRMLRQRAAEAGVTLRNEMPDGAPAIHADSQRLRQVILNLVGNAIKFSAAGAEVVVRHVASEHGHGLQVVDRGIGMPAEQIATAFEPFSQLHSGFDRKYDGTGLGLPLVHRYMELHGGSVEIESASGAGTTVTVLFPGVPTAPARAASR